MERMGDILARTALRRARQARPTTAGLPAADSTRPAPAVAGTQAAQPTRSTHSAPRAHALRDAVAPRPPATKVSQPLALPQPGESQTHDVNGAARAQMARADLTETPPGILDGAGAASARRIVPADVRLEGESRDRILEIAPRSVPAPERKPQPSSNLSPARRVHPNPSSTQQAARHGFMARSDTPLPLMPRKATNGTLAGDTAHARGSDAGSPAPRGARPGGSHLRESGGGYRAGSDATRAAQPSLAPSGAPAPCPICGGAGYVRVDVPLGDPGFGKPLPCECKDRQIEERRRSDLRRLSSLDPFLDKTFETFDAALQGVREGFEVARAFAEDPDGWLVLSGPHGVGKTHLAAAIANYQLAQGNSVFFSIVPDLLDHLRAAFAPSSEVTYDEMFDKVREAGLLVLDDLGAENSTAWATEKLFQLINYRYNFRMPTVITTNVRLLSQMDERIRSRLSDIGLARQVLIKAQDYRERHVGRMRRPGGDGDGHPYGQGRDRR